MTSPILPCKKTEKIMAAQQILFFGGNTQNLFFGGEHLEQEDFFFRSLSPVLFLECFLLQLV